MTKNRIYKVVFKIPPLGHERTEFYFGSLSAIYDVFKETEIGCKVNNLWNIGVSDGNTYKSKLCTITREAFISKAQKNPRGKQK